jgi:hypothetical protein
MQTEVRAMKPHLEPDREQIAAFVTLFKHASTGSWVSLRAFPDDDDTKPFRIAPIKLNGDLDALIDAACADARRAANAKRKVVFCPPVATFTNDKRAREEDLHDGLVLSVELDRSPQASLTTLEGLLGPATVVVESGGVTNEGEPKLHAHWLLSKPARTKAEHDALKAARKFAARAVGADGTNIPLVHPIRWPGSWHRKGEPKLCKIRDHRPDREIALADALKSLKANSADDPHIKEATGEAGRSSEFAELIEAVITSKSFHEPLNRLAAKVIAKGLHEDAAINLLQGLMEAASGPRDARWQARYDDIPRAVMSALGKFGHVNDIVSVRLADVEAKPIEWVWHHRIARGKITILSGDPGVSKSILSLDLAARLTTEAKWPDGLGKAPLGSVIILSAEDDVADTIRVRFAAAGGDATKCHVLQAVKEKDGERTFDMTRDLPKLQRMIEDLGDVIAVIADPVNAYMGRPGKLDSWRDTDLRGVLTPLAKIAADKHVAVIAIVHLTKDGRRSALMSVMGSVAMVAAARSVYLVIEDAADPKRILFLRTKSNIAPKGDAAGLGYRIHERPTGLDTVPYAPGVVWEDGDVAMTADDAIAANRATKDKRHNPDIDKAATMITEMLAKGDMPAAWVQARLKAEGISQSTWRKAMVKCGVEAYQPNVPGPWFWRIVV